MSPPVVLCIDHETLVAAMACIKQTVETVPAHKERLELALADLDRAHTQFLMIERGLPAMLRKQAI